MNVRDFGQISLAEIQRLIGELVLTSEAQRLRNEELSAALADATKSSKETL